MKRPASADIAAPVSLRVNPDVDAGTHPYISTGLRENKFGIAVDTALETYRQAAALPHLRVTGIDCHIGSQLTDTRPFVDALERVLRLVGKLQERGHPAAAHRPGRRSRHPLPGAGQRPRHRTPMFVRCWKSWVTAGWRFCWSRGAPSSATPASC